MPSYGEYQKPAGVLKSCGCDSMCGCSTKKNIPGISCHFKLQRYIGKTKKRPGHKF